MASHNETSDEIMQRAKEEAERIIREGNGSPEADACAREVLRAALERRNARLGSQDEGLRSVDAPSRSEESGRLTGGAGVNAAIEGDEASVNMQELADSEPSYPQERTTFKDFMLFVGDCIRDAATTIWPCLFSIITVVLIMATFLLEKYLEGGGAFPETNMLGSVPSDVLYVMGGFDPALFVLPDEWPRIFLPSLLHADGAHIANNLICLIPALMAVEMAYGKIGFLLVAFASMVTSTAVSLGVANVTGNVNIISVGASDLAFGMIAAGLVAIVIHPKKAQSLGYVPEAFYLAAFWTVMYFLFVGDGSLLSWIADVESNVSITAHVVGALGGAIAALMVPKRDLKTPIWLRIAAAVAWMAAIGAFFAWYMGVQPVRDEMHPPIITLFDLLVGPNVFAGA
ncbi:MAG TPA: rhomboid family intramembrane serine protease [Slackia equolifaciens]|uniref:Rhomboid family intramembrane serine protease n=1 Tax=Slackia equolifaciens TaxID=498718 RepID=A0A9D3A0J8_9ACTN|nr:rhomboid family intramembrane serine protease [Slackia equolifaciens]